MDDNNTKKVYDTCIGTIEIPGNYHKNEVNATATLLPWVKEKLQRISTHAPADIDVIEDALAAAGHVWHGLPAIEGSEDKDVLQLQGDPSAQPVWAELARTCLTLIKLEHQSLREQPFREVDLFRPVKAYGWVALQFIKECGLRRIYQRWAYSADATRIPEDGYIFQSYRGGNIYNPHLCEDDCCLAADVFSPLGSLYMNTSLTEITWLACHAADRELYLSKEALLTPRQRNRIRAFIGDPDLPVSDDFGSIGLYLLTPSPATMDLNKRTLGEAAVMKELVPNQQSVRFCPPAKGWSMVAEIDPLKEGIMARQGDDTNPYPKTEESTLRAWVQAVSQDMSTSGIPLRNVDFHRARRLREVLRVQEQS